jgi:hypothetical protein
MQSGWPDEFVKKRPEYSPNHFLSKLMHHGLNHERKMPKMWATYVILFKNLPKVNTHPKIRPIWSPCMQYPRSVPGAHVWNI